MTDDTAKAIPIEGRAADELLAQIKAQRAEEIDWRGGRAFSLVYNPDDEALEQLLGQVALTYLHDNALNPFKYPGLMAMEQELIAMACGLLGTAPRNGAVTSGGTESIFCAVQTARDHAAETRGVTAPRLVAPITGHPAFAKACKYLGIAHVRVPVRDDGRADVAAMAEAIDDDTVLVVGSAPCFPYGVIDPIPELAALAAERGACFHTDACLGGWMLPWWERLGVEVPGWDFRVPGVTSISADIHKYGYTVKGASIVAYRDRDLLRRQQFWYDDWPGGLYASGTTAGTRPAPPIAMAWATVNHLGQEGYLAMAGTVLETTRRFRDGIGAIEGLEVTHEPDMSLMEFSSDPGSAIPVDVGGVADVMDARGWHLDRQPGGLHLMVSPYHAKVVDEFCEDLAAAVASHGADAGVEGAYGGVV